MIIKWHHNNQVYYWNFPIQGCNPYFWHCLW